MPGEDFAATPLFEDTFENELMNVRNEMSKSAVAPRQDKRDKKRKNPNGRRVDAPALTTPTPAVDTSSPVPPTPIPQPPQGQISTPAPEAPVAVEAVMDLFGTIPDAVNDVAQLASTVQKFAPVKPAMIALALGAGAAFVAFLTLRGEQ